MKEHTTALFIIAMYHWFTGNEQEARDIIAIANSVSQKKMLLA